MLMIDVEDIYHITAGNAGDNKLRGRSDRVVDGDILIN